MLIAFNQMPDQAAALPNTSYGFYAMALAEILREPGLDLVTMFERIRLRTHDLSQGAQTPWNVNALNQPIILLPGATAAAEAPMLAKRSRAIRDLPGDEAYARAVEIDTIPVYEEFLAAHPRHARPGACGPWSPCAARPITGSARGRVNTDRAYWSYLLRYPRGSHAAEAQAGSPAFRRRSCRHRNSKRLSMMISPRQAPRKSPSMRMWWWKSAGMCCRRRPAMPSISCRHRRWKSSNCRRRPPIRRPAPAASGHWGGDCRCRGDWCRNLGQPEWRRPRDVRPAFVPPPRPPRPSILPPGTVVPPPPPPISVRRPCCRAVPPGRPATQPGVMPPGVAAGRRRLSCRRAREASGHTGSAGGPAAPAGRDAAGWAAASRRLLSCRRARVRAHRFAGGSTTRPGVMPPGWAAAAGCLSCRRAASGRNGSAGHAANPTGRDAAGWAAAAGCCRAAGFASGTPGPLGPQPPQPGVMPPATPPGAIRPGPSPATQPPRPLGTPPGGINRVPTAPPPPGRTAATAGRHPTDSPASTASAGHAPRRANAARAQPAPAATGLSPCAAHRAG